MATITFDPTDEGDLEWVRSLLNEPVSDEVEETPAPKKATRGKAKPVPEPEPEPEEDPMAKAAELATELVSNGRTPEVKAVLADFGVKRVSELGEEQVGDFIEALEALSV